MASNATVIINEGRDKLSYREFCAAHPEMPVFFQDWYLDAVCENGFWDAVLLRGQAGEVRAVWPFFMKKKWGFRYITMPLFVKYMGPWAAATSGAIEWPSALEEGLPMVDAFKQNFHYAVSDTGDLGKKGYAQRLQHTFLLNIGDLDAVFRGVNRNMRRNILKAQRAVEVLTDNDPERFYPVSTWGFRRKGLATPYSGSLFMAHDAALAKRGQRQIFFAVDAQGRTHSAAYLIWDQHSAYYHLSGDDTLLRRSGSGFLLIWEAIRYAREVLGLSVFDFEGSMLPEVAAVRRQFGAIQTNYRFVWRYRHPLLKAALRIGNR